MSGDLIVVFDDGDDAFERRVLRRLDHIVTELHTLNRKADQIMTDQDQADAVAAEIEKDVAAEASALDEIKAEIAALQDQHPAVDFSGVNAALAKLDTETAAEQTVAEPAPEPTPEPTPTAVLPLYTVDGDVNDDPTQWIATSSTTSDGHPLFTYAGDVAGGPASGDGIGGIWHYYSGAVVTV